MSLPVFSKQGSEAGLLEIPVVGQRVGYVPLLHDKKARAVREAPTLVAARRVPFHGGPELRVRLRDDLNAGIGLKLVNHPGLRMFAEIHACPPLS